MQAAEWLLKYNGTGTARPLREGERVLKGLVRAVHTCPSAHATRMRTDTAEARLCAGTTRAAGGEHGARCPARVQVSVALREVHDGEELLLNYRYNPTRVRPAPLAPLASNVCASIFSWLASTL